MNQRVRRTCVAMSGLARPQVLATKISFSDAIGSEVRMVRGTDKHGHIKHLLCAYNRSNGRAETQDADAWDGLSMRP